MSFVAGQTAAILSIDIRDDVTNEANETLVITLGTPTGGVTLGSVSELTLTITDNDQAPHIVTSPQSQIAALGSNTT
ncbi:MAG: hypothetical protein ABL974_15050, partial [Prosthecobacter sp.]